MAKQKTMIMNKFKGSLGWLWFWIIMFFPVAIAYYFMNLKPVEVKIEKE